MRSMIELGGKIIYDDGSEASPEDVKAFWAAKEEFKVNLEIDAIEKQANRKVWEEKYLANMREYFGYDDEPFSNFKNWSDADLVWQLSTTFFDASACEDEIAQMIFDRGGYIELYDIPAGDLKKCISTASEYFPDHWKAALIGFAKGEHDT
jgi:hypothetical protein